MVMIILLHLLQLDLLLLTKTKLIPSPTAQSKGGKIIQYSRTLFGFSAACCYRLLKPSDASEGERGGGEREGGSQRVMRGLESGERHELTGNCFCVSGIDPRECLHQLNMLILAKGLFNIIIAAGSKRH